MQVAWGQSARALIDRALELAVERRARVTTLHLAAALMEEGGDGAQVLCTRGVRAQDLRSAAKVHPEEPGTFERIQTAAKRIAAARASETSPTHLLVAALGDKTSALASLVAQLGCDPLALADDVLRGSPRARHGVVSRNGIIYRGESAAAAAGAGAPQVVSSIPARDADPRLVTTPAARAATPPAQARVSAARAPAINAPGSRETPSGIIFSGPSGHGPQNATTTAGPIGQLSGAPSTMVKIVGSPGAPGPARSSRSAPVRPTRVEKTEHDLDPRTFPAIAMFARNLSAEGARGVLDPVVGREREVRRVLDAVGRRDGRGALVVGMPGVGKTTLLRAIAREPGGRAVLTLRHAEVAAQARGQQGAERVRKLVEELITAADRTIVALDPVAPWFLTRDAPDDVVLELRAALAAGKISWIGTATVEEARKLAEVETWVERAAVRVDLDEPSPRELREVVRAFAPAIGAHHSVVADGPVLEYAAELSERFLGGRAQPDRALSVIDLALARTRRLGDPALLRDTVAGVVAELGGVPVDRVAATDGERLLALESHLASRVVGHAAALARVAHTLRRNAVGFRGARPIGTFLFLGPTGVGKTEAAKAIADALFPGTGAMTRFDMAEFSESHAVARLVGAPPGYVGYNDGGQLTEAVRRRPYQLVLLDEIEKAHRDVLEALLALLDEGRMTDGRGRTVDFRNTVIVMTSNLGADVFARATAAPSSRAIGFGARESVAPPRGEPTALEARALESARAALPPELWNRIDDPVVFGPLSRDEVSEIARRLLHASFERLYAEQGVRVTASPGVVDLLLENGGYEPSLGARPMRRAIARLIEAPIAESVLRGALRRGDAATLEIRDWGVEVRPVRNESSDATSTRRPV